jgi:hypothetical protein
MRCVTHYDREAVALCPECGACLCPECYNYTNGHYCYSCVGDTYRSHRAMTKRYTKSIITWTIVLGVLGIIAAAALASDPTALEEGMEFVPAICVIFGLLGGFAYGGARYANKGESMSFASKIWMFVLSLVLAPIFFVIRLVDYLKVRKTLKDLEESYRDYPR